MRLSYLVDRYIQPAIWNEFVYLRYLLSQFLLYAQLKEIANAIASEEASCKDTPQRWKHLHDLVGHLDEAVHQFRYVVEIL